MKNARNKLKQKTPITLLPLWLILISSLFCLSANSASNDNKNQNTILDFWDLLINEGGVLIYVLFFLSFISIVLILFYFLTIRQGAIVTKSFMQNAEKLIQSGDFLGLISLCSKRNQAVSKITHKALDFAMKNPTASFTEIREVTEAEGSHQASILGNRISYLADIGAIAPMVGLLGTVLGMIKAFNELSQTVGILQAELSGGVAEALITTASGLVIGIVALIFYSIFRGKVQKLISAMESSSTHILALISTQFKKETLQVIDSEEEL